MQFSSQTYFGRIFKHLSFFAPKSGEVTSQKRLYINCLPDSDCYDTKRRRVDVRRFMPSFISISARVQELFRKTEGAWQAPAGGYGLTRHRLGCFCTHHSLGGGGRIRPPPAISKTDGRRETDEAAFERSRRDASKPLSKIQNWGHVSGQGQVKGQNRVFSGCRP